MNTARSGQNGWICAQADLLSGSPLSKRGCLRSILWQSISPNVWSSIHTAHASDSLAGLFAVECSARVPCDLAHSLGPTIRNPLYARYKRDYAHDASSNDLTECVRKSLRSHRGGSPNHCGDRSPYLGAGPGTRRFQGVCM